LVRKENNQKPINQIAIIIMKMTHRINLVAAGLIGAGALTVNAQTYLWYGHADVGVNYENGSWDLHVHHHDLGEFEPGDVILGVDITAASNTVPAGTQWSFLGSPGSPVWILPQTFNPNLLFLGLGAEELADGIFTNDQVVLTLKAVDGPGHFALYETGMFGNPTVFMNSRDGIDSGDAIILNAGAHRHANWAFSEPGLYRVDVEASGTLVGGVFTSSGDVTYLFEVTSVPEPGSLVLLALGGVSLLLQARRRS
jgi:surface-anchored protein